MSEKYYNHGRALVGIILSNFDCYVLKNNLFLFTKKPKEHTKSGSIQMC